MKMLPPQNIDAEKSALGAILIDQSVMLDVIEVLNPEDFYRADHGLIYQSMVRLFSQSKPIDIITVTEELFSSGELEKAGGAQYVISLTEDPEEAQADRKRQTQANNTAIYFFIINLLIHPIVNVYFRIC